MPFLNEIFYSIYSINPNEKLRRVQGKILFSKFLLVFVFFLPSELFANNYKKKLDLRLKNLVKNGSVMIANDQKILYSYPEKTNVKFIPASVLKLATALASIHYLGLDFKFKTEFYLSKKNSLVIRGFGDPFLVSEIWEIIAKDLNQLPEMPKKLKKMSFDNSLFDENIRIPGIGLSKNPYDAKNGPLIVNFNTVFLKVASNGQIFSAEKQTPLTPLARRIAKKLSIGYHRIRLPERLELIYAGEVIRNFLSKEGIFFDSSKISVNSVNLNDNLIYTHFNRMTISQIIAGMMLYSNNFTANQLLLTIGLKRYGAPATLKKGNKAISEYLNKELKIPLNDFKIFEGSGISRKNRLKSESVISLLKAFSKKQFLLNNYKGVFLKTGTLNGVYSMAGYLRENIYFSILLNQQKNNRDKILDIISTIDSF